MKKVVISNIVLAIAFVLIGYWFYSKTVGIGTETAKAKAEKFFKENSQGVDIKVAGVVEENNLYKLDVTDGNQHVPFYMTKDGSKMFPQVIDVDGEEAEKVAEKPAPVDVPKTDKPSVELFVMSYCPYGTQIEKGILPVLDTLKDKIDFKLKFVDYAMHDKKEIDENLRQYCIQKEDPSKLKDYLDCFLKNGDNKDASTQCLRDTKVNTIKINECIAAADKEFKITENFQNKSSWQGQFPPFNVDKDANDKYSVKGSPTLIVNGVEVKSQRDPASLLKNVCSGFNDQPDECKKELESAAPSPGFGDGKGPNNAAAGCGE